MHPVELPNGIVIEGVPDGTSKEEVKQKAIAGGYITAEEFPAPPQIEQLQQTPELSLDERQLIETDYNIDYGQMAKNLPQSLLGAAEAITMPITKPREFFGGVANLFTGFTDKAAKAIGGSESEPIGKRELGSGDSLIDSFINDHKDLLSRDRYSKIPIADAAIEYYKGYFDLNEFKRRVEKDPAGVALDIAALTTGGALVATKIGKAAKASYTKDLPISMIESVGKFSTSPKFTSAQRKELAKFLLDEGIPLTPAGVDKLINLTETLNRQIDILIGKADKGNKQIARLEVLSGLAKIRKNTLGKIRGQKDRDIIDKIMNNYMKEIEFTGSPTMGLKELQEFKKDVYREINWVTPTRKEKKQNKSYKSIGRRSKEILEENVPGIKELNRREGQAINALEHVTRSSNRIANRDVAGIDLAIKPGAGTVLAPFFGLSPGTGAAIGGVAHVFGRPRIKGSVAQRLYNFKKSKPLATDKALSDMILTTYPQLFDYSGNEDENN